MKGAVEKRSRVGLRDGDGHWFEVMRSGYYVKRT
jgi:hypothetical protein